MFQIQGSGNIIAKERAVSSFIKLHLTTGGTSEIIQSDEEKVLVECDDNLQEHIQAINSGRTLYITQESGLRKAHYTKLHIKVYVRHIDTLLINTTGNVICSQPLVSTLPFKLEINAEGNTEVALRAPSLKCVARCQGNVTLRGEAGDASIKTQMQGDFFAREFMAARLKFRGMSQGNTELYASESISITHMSQGYVHYYGPGVLKDIRFMGEGGVKHMN